MKKLIIIILIISISLSSYADLLINLSGYCCLCGKKQLYLRKISIDTTKIDTLTWAGTGQIDVIWASSCDQCKGEWCERVRKESCQFIKEKKGL